MSLSKFFFTGTKDLTKSFAASSYSQNTVLKETKIDKQNVFTQHLWGTSPYDRLSLYLAKTDRYSPTYIPFM